jgi:UDP-glucose 4-epimerase
VLVTGGAGYIGSHMVKLLREQGRPLLVVDNLSTGHRDAVGDAPFVVLDVAESERLAALMREHAVEAVIHFAAHSIVGESVANPAKYQRNNVEGARGLLRAMRSAGVERIVFSSSAAVYGEPQRTPIDEAHPLAPINPYGATKLEVERLLEGEGMRHVSLRYFNAAGADPQGTLGERHDPETHLLPIVLQAAAGRRAHIEVYGTDYPTRDGSCERDYVHVVDLCEAHVLALEWLEAGGRREVCNLGSERSATVLEVIDAVRRHTGRDFAVKRGARRAGDPAVLVASCERARRVLGWKPVRSDLATIVRDAWRWEQRRSD